MGPAEGPAFPSRILQLHPTRRCKLRCIHCYSDSGPREHEELPAALLRDALGAARAEGYTVAGFSGGEPLLYGALPGLLERARRLGMTTTVTTNGMLLDQNRLAMLREHLSLLAISLDGVPASHNRMRASGRAFETMARRLDGVRRSGIPFGFIFTLTQHNVQELEWVAEFATQEGAVLVQVHPLEIVGRAATHLADARPDEIEASHAFLEVARIEERFGDRLIFQLDVFDRELIRAAPCRVFADGPRTMNGARPFAELVSPLVIEPDGTVVPIRYGFGRDYALGNIRTNPLGSLTATWQRERYVAFLDLCARVFEEVGQPAELPFLNWYELLARRSMERVDFSGRNDSLPLQVQA